MGYMRKDEVMKALQEDLETTLACYDEKEEKYIVKFCYECIGMELNKLPQYVLENAVEQQKIYDVDKVIDQLEDEKEYADADFEAYVQETVPNLDSEYDDTYSHGMERAIQIMKEASEHIYEGKSK